MRTQTNNHLIHNYHSNHTNNNRDKERIRMQYNHCCSSEMNVCYAHRGQSVHSMACPTYWITFLSEHFELLGLVSTKTQKPFSGYESKITMWSCCRTYQSKLILPVTNTFQQMQKTREIQFKIVNKEINAKLATLPHFVFNLNFWHRLVK